ncbi:hypothetical protein CBM2609_A20076 [Cupriavidus taiwanensis]|uniref:Uncharacterized protein n=1 Tax=Cupriavidus taiwanensis TaxID=164546 RepID=A0A976AUB7_9BURK|nr:hypothetical protein CBM2604_A20076 [Cupriavidus taiwanensis]SOZ26415.1 hypothetical protein CBM2609_A20076 [Cupriavidus taiwanensis]SOZ45279.1 hypothetical protein CBM2610_A20065 [Cupriavidus taiwanensis]SOZ53220.1 hypothetical protein CBM2614_A20036 [Cupriavidus taiwanensis]SOZ55008.1 hypothetical protein CBM2613_A20038 [Cupriavidus taiwanensis]
MLRPVLCVAFPARRQRRGQSLQSIVIVRKHDIRLPHIIMRSLN